MHCGLLESEFSELLYFQSNICDLLIFLACLYHALLLNSLHCELHVLVGEFSEFSYFQSILYVFLILCFVFAVL